MNIYETKRLLDEYLLFHYGADDEVLPWTFGPKDALKFAQRSVNELLDPAIIPQQARALDLGCAVGRSSYELAQHCREVIGIDYSHAFIQAAETIQQEGAFNYSRIDEAAETTRLQASRPALRARAHIQFEQGDAMNLREDLGSFEVVHAANLLCRLSEPQRLLDRLASLVKTNGQLLLTTPCTWLEEYTPSKNWPGGSTLEWLQEKLARHFTLAQRVDLPFLIREHARKFQWSVALGMRWVRR
ncbi:MAG: putative 4-mercaptohistidine N1-methyltransferase [Verrucomicrobia bacterium]|nr:putative 4-mercaptohistidine N1-methyltransferase [Verrucomicrobiota bacterium]